MNRTAPKSATWLGGVCAEIAHRLNWSAAGVRAAAVLALLVWPLVTGAAYLVAAWLLRRGESDRHAGASSPRAASSDAPPSQGLDERDLDAWDRRLADLDRRLGL